MAKTADRAVTDKKAVISNDIAVINRNGRLCTSIMENEL